MLEKIRESSQGVAAKVILGLVILTFALAGIGSYLGNPPVQPAARVNGEDILVSSLNNAYENERARMQAQMGEMFEQLTADPNYMRTFRERVLDRLISDKLAEQRAFELGLRVSDDDIKQAIVQMPEFQIDGVFDNNRYLALLRQSGYQPDAFRDYLRAQMTRAQLLQALVGTEFALEKETSQVLSLQQQTRTVEFVEIAAETFELAEPVSEDEITSYYNANLSRFNTPEQISLEYILLSAELLAADIDVSEEQVKQAYEASASNYTKEERRRVSHILIDFGDDSDAAKAEADAILARLNAGEDFAELAKTESDDIVSGEIGGELDWFERGIMDPAFEDAAFNLNQEGDISDVVTSSFGYHIVKLLEIDEETIKPYDQVREEVLAKVKADRANELFYDKSSALTEAAFENPDSLEIAAEIVGVSAVESPLFSRDDVPADLNDPALLFKLFDPEFIALGENSDLIELSNGDVIVARVIEHKPVATEAKADVQDEIVALLTEQKLKQEALAYAELLQASWGSEESSVLMQGKNLELKRIEALNRFGRDADFKIVNAAFDMPMPSADSPSLRSIELSNGNAALVNLVKVNQATINLTDNDKDRFASEEAQRVYQAFLDAERAQAKIEILSVL